MLTPGMHWRPRQSLPYRPASTARQAATYTRPGRCPPFHHGLSSGQQAHLGCPRRHVASTRRRRQVPRRLTSTRFPARSQMCTPASLPLTAVLRQRRTPAAARRRRLRSTTSACDVTSDPVCSAAGLPLPTFVVNLRILGCVTQALFSVDALPC
ncbi:hypothetical protein NN561_014305 [Cricetulus griseus]